MKIVEENLFTKSQTNNIINKKYNPLKVDDEIYEREGLFMRGTKDVVLDEVTKGLNWKERAIVRIFSRTFIKVYNELRINIVNAMLK